ncbi:phosphoribosylaminoimidazolecarboxamide formyltransferase/IMP cyclohydrolase [Thermosporothrix hazakensis]|jgi:phosphoribosylaminoimidazolecarboxamide formyltransferase/IMP cyclohydrolase|uniref:Bifunctional purine biosynthesis protein PurH n=1 Tax=Thermosporothrix hazakensis TaxID=644383 RepID=A0A326UA90_THEHA|nr:bifunctional phosphoribosylaminoimidazolecarboxamide formyltransferase/IMP cyclohydrolase [Thermosporothrix hazakensis]PZW24645.1 phosphoribosylaminoimidazolecarboxamide formyltransferase/IMP cyclohydrolase [Thermosporothrix hazakensis]GCE48406.1 bifunctional purine biosynthesis protein PurH [Thermosporothrix hazakensis]
MRALISVADRTGLVELVQELESLGVSIFATDNTCKALKAKGVTVSSASELLPPAMHLDERTIYPLLTACIARKQTTGRHPKQNGNWQSVEIVVANLAPYREKIARPELTLNEALEHIDLERAAFLRTAAKHFLQVLVLCRPRDYMEVVQEWKEQGEVSIETRKKLAAIAFQQSALYDTTVAEYLWTPGEGFPEELTLPFERVMNLRYGENPHQQAAFYRWAGVSCSRLKLPTLADAEQIQGPELSYNNLLDLDTALSIVQNFTAPTATIIKHTSPCGLACGDTLVDAYKKAHAGDPLSSTAGIIGCNRLVDEETAQEISQLFYEAIIAPGYSREALAILRQQKELRLLTTNTPIEPGNASTQWLHTGRPEIRSVNGGILIQTPDAVGDKETEYRVVTEREPNLDEVTDLMFAWKAVRFVKSNAIVLARKLAIIGVGGGQTNRAASVQLAIDRAGTRARGSVLASDAYFPYPDGVELAARAGITAIVQPGGSSRDEEAIRVANQYAIAMVFTGRRHFRH